MNDVATTLARTQALILAGGRGERLFPLTLSRPKPCIPFCGRFRIIDFTLSNCLNSGLSRVSLLTQYRREQIHAYVRDGWSRLWKSATSDRSPLICFPPASGKHYRGTADAVLQNVALFESEKPDFVLVLSADHIYDMDYRDLLHRHVETGADLTMGTVEHPICGANQFGVVDVDTAWRVIGFEEKPSTPHSVSGRPEVARISMGVYVFKTNALVWSLMENCDAGQGCDFGRDVIPSLVASGRAYAYDFRDQVTAAPRYWRDIGTLDSYYESSMDFVRSRHRWPLQTAARIETWARVSASAHVLQSVISDGVRIEDGAHVTDSVLMPGVKVGRGARIRRAIVEDDVEIPNGVHIGFDLENDRKRHLVTDAGVVIVADPLGQLRPNDGCQDVLQVRAPLATAA
jgi:glucose-1-phosphate adenylyltransferase